MNDLTSYLKDNLHLADELGRLQRRSYELPATERRLAEQIIADRELRVGTEYVAIVRERATENGVETYVDCERLPDLHKVLAHLQRGVMIVDTETTGLYPARGNRVVSVAVLGARAGWTVECTADEIEGHLVMNGPIGWEVEETGHQYHCKVNPGRASDPEAARIHGLTDLSGAPAFSEIEKELHGWLNGAVFVAHNAPFDEDFLDAEFRRLGMLEPMYEYVIDTRVVSKMLWPDAKGSLDALAERLGVDRGDRDICHDALGDCRLLARCLPGLMTEIQKRLANV